MIFKLRKFIPEDAKELVQHANNPTIAQFMKDAFPSPYRLKNAHWFIDFAQNTSDRDILAICVNNKVCGSIGLHFTHDILRKNAEIGYWLGQEF